MASTSLAWQVPLAVPPRVRGICGRAAHGLQGIERYQVGFWALNFIQGQGVLRIQGRDVPFAPGYVTLTPPDTPFEFRYHGPAVVSWVHFLTEPTAAASPVPAVQDLGSRFVTMRANVIDAAVWQAQRPALAQSRIWDLLWQLVEPPAESSDATGGLHPALLEALRYIESHLHLSLSVTDLSVRAGCSSTHLNRLCRAFTGSSLSDYIRQLRMDRARQLLQHSRLPIAEIGTQVGMADPHVFNKAFRRTFGESPSALRAGMVDPNH